MIPICNSSYVIISYVIISYVITYVIINDHIFFLDRYNICPSVPELLFATVESGAIDGNASFFQCTFEADYTYFVSYWTIMGSDQQLITVNETSPLNNYSVRVYQDCLLTTECCEVASELTITNTPISLDNATVTCYAGLPSPDDLIISSDAILSKHLYTVHGIIISILLLCMHIS